MPTTIYITRDCLNVGITECPMAQLFDYGSMFSAGDWHYTRAEAVSVANAKRDAEITRLEKRLAQLRAMKFE